mmetsp:Transcript_62482/g.116107  ORF Transcript_62482/g.116107 Transcript_62482/m.116107 type:complete len:449 (+) Transcript_62482:38-1384(+)
MSSLALAATPVCNLPDLLEVLQQAAQRSELWQALIKAALPLTRTRSKRQNFSVGEEDLVLEAWLDCQPNGLVTQRDTVTRSIPMLASYFESTLDVQKPADVRLLNEHSCCFTGAVHLWQRHGLCREMSTREQKAREVFQGVGRRGPLFSKWLKDDGMGQVHFLQFWQAFGRAERHICGGAEPNHSVVLLELEEVRDTVLAYLEDEAKVERSTLAAARLATVDLYKAVCSMAAKSAIPDFWRIIALCLQVAWQEQEDFDIAALGVIMIAWFDDASAVRRLVNVPSVPRALPRGKLVKTRVLLNVYDVSQEDGVQQLNMLLAHTMSPLKLGGFFHTGVEVNGLEWYYGQSCGKMATGVCCCAPRENCQHHFRQTVEMVATTMSREQIAEVIADLIEEYSGADYDLLRRNCCHWADDFCKRIGAGSLPAWVHRLARIGANVDNAWKVVALT